MQLDRQPSAVIFDMDGLLFDTEALHQEAILAAAAEMGREMPVALFHRMLGHPWPSNHALLLAEWGDADEVEELRGRWHKRFQGLAATRLALKPGVTELLDALDKLDVPCAIATSSGHPAVQDNLSAHGLAGRFRTVVARGDYSAGKPAPDPYLLAAERLAVAPRHCWALEDSHNGVRSAAAAGMVTIMVPDLIGPTDEIRCLCAAVVLDLHEVCRAVMAVGRERS